MSKQSFAPVPNMIMRRKDLSHGVKLCFGRLLQYAGSDGCAFPKLTTLGEELGVSSRAAARFISELKSHGLVRVEQRGAGLSNVYIPEPSLLLNKPKRGK